MAGKQARSDLPVVSEKPTIARRELLAFGVAASGAVVAGVQLATALSAGTSRSSGGPTSAPANESIATPAAPTSAASVEAVDDGAMAYLGDLLGHAVGACTVVAVGAVERGGIPVTLATASGVSFRVDVLRLDPADGYVGVGAASDVAVYLRNGGDGRKATHEEMGLGAMALAHELRRRAKQPPPALRTMGERAALDALVT